MESDYVYARKNAKKKIGKLSRSPKLAAAQPRFSFKKEKEKKPFL